MSEKKMIGRNVAITLGIVAVILLVGLVGVIANYTSIINAKDNTIATKNSEIANKDSQISNLQTWLDGNLSLIGTLNAPSLIKVDLRASDNRPWFATPYLHVYGYVCNVGTNTAYSSKIHVVAYQSGGVVAIDTYITLGTIYGESWRSVDSNIYYSGSELASYALTLEWTA